MFDGCVIAVSCRVFRNKTCLALHAFGLVSTTFDWTEITLRTMCNCTGYLTFTFLRSRVKYLIVCQTFVTNCVILVAKLTTCNSTGIECALIFSNWKFKTISTSVASWYSRISAWFTIFYFTNLMAFSLEIVKVITSSALLANRLNVESTVC